MLPQQSEGRYEISSSSPVPFPPHSLGKGNHIEESYGFCCGISPSQLLAFVGVAHSRCELEQMPACSEFSMNTQRSESQRHLKNVLCSQSRSNSSPEGRLQGKYQKSCMELCNLLPDLCKVVRRSCPKKKGFQTCGAAAHSWVCCGRSCSQLPAVLFPICHWGSHCSIGSSGHERRESKCFFQSCRGVLEGLSYDPASHSRPGVAEEPSPVPMPRTRHRAALSHVALPPSLSQPPCKDSNCLQTYNPTTSPHWQGVDAALGAGLSVQPSHSPWVLHPRHGSPEALPVLIWQDPGAITPVPVALYRSFRHCIARSGTDLKGAQCSLREFSAAMQSECPHRDFKQSSSIKAQPHQSDSPPTEIAIEIITNRSMRKRRTIAQNKPLLLTATGLRPLKIEKRNQGTEEMQLLAWPWYSPNSDVEDVAAHRAGHSHVPQALPGHDDTGDECRKSDHIDASTEPRSIFLSSVLLFWMLSTFANLTSVVQDLRAFGDDSPWIYGMIRSTVHVLYITQYRLGGCSYKMEMLFPRIQAMQRLQTWENGPRDSGPEEICSSVHDSRSRWKVDSYRVSDIRQSAPERKDNGKEEESCCRLRCHCLTGGAVHRIKNQKANIFSPKEQNKELQLLTVASPEQSSHFQSVSASILDYYTQSLFIEDSDRGWVLSQQLWRGKERTCEGQPGWALSACAPDLGTCPSCGTSAFCVSLLGSDSVAGVTWTLLGAFFPSSARAIRRNAAKRNTETSVGTAEIWITRSRDEGVKSVQHGSGCLRDVLHQHRSGALFLGLLRDSSTVNQALPYSAELLFLLIYSELWNCHWAMHPSDWLFPEAAAEAPVSRVRLSLRLWKFQLLARCPQPGPRLGGAGSISVRINR
ncbi:hypothetical protein EK904_001798 [Melospiza melodia maxima]|nr:hypothetical protein EK904_001798 [Melospiza melodia maxima]